VDNSVSVSDILQVTKLWIQISRDEIQ
jgi:hypothetical protein